MYTWGYIIASALAKLDLDDMDENETTVQTMLSRFPIYANEAMTQICSIKPYRKYAEFTIRESDVGIEQNMPDDFIGFGDNVNTREYELCYCDNRISYRHKDHEKCVEECHDDDITFVNYNTIKFNKIGKYNISYNARWFTFTSSTDESTKLNVPLDVLDCLPSYMASQGYKIEDETKSAIYRNEYEMFLSRLDDTNFKNTKTFIIGGDW